jgi:pimeloyl-ACP methyl ester carboxylesterase
MKKFIKYFIAIVITGGLIWGIGWATYARPPLPEALASLESDQFVQVSEQPWLTFSPAEHPPTTGLIFYPGGRIDPRGYAPLMRALAAEGFLVVVPSFPINMAVFNPNVGDDIIAFYPTIEHWVIAGHSVGGTMAAQYTDKHPESIEGLAIWASYPANSSDLSDLNIPVISIYGGNEIRVTDEAVAQRSHLLPAETHYIRIEGGDHHQFGAYQINPEDHLATTRRETQHAQIIEATLEVLQTVSLGE